jgi:aldose 1-epimerase
MKTTFREVVLKNSQIELTILPEAGCHWPSLRIPQQGKWIDLLAPVADYASILSAPSSLGSYIMAPWANRLPGGVLEFEGQKHTLRLNFPDNTAIHGDLRKRAWKVVEVTPVRFRAELDSAEHPDFNYPFHLKFEYTVELQGDTLTQNFFMTNKDKRPAPAGFGYHPFFKRQLYPGRKDPLLTLPARKIFLAQEHMPTGPAIAVEDRTDFRSAKQLGTPALDDCFTELTDQRIQLSYPEDGVEVFFELDPLFRYVVLYIPTQPDGRGAEFFAIEPQTLVTGALPLTAKGWKDTGLKVLAPGERWGAPLKIKVEQIKV